MAKSGREPKSKPTGELERKVKVGGIFYAIFSGEKPNGFEKGDQKASTV